MDGEPTTTERNHRNGGSWRPALAIALVYGVVGALWVLLSDRLIGERVDQVETLTRLQSYKGFFFITLSAALIFLLVWAHARRAKHLELALRQSESYYRTVINRAQEGFWRIDADHRTIAVNDSLCEMLGYRRAELLGRTPFEFVNERNRAVFEEQLARSRHTAAMRDYEITLQDKAGSAVPALFHATTLWDEQGRAAGSYAFVTDIRRIKRVEESLQRSNRALLTVSGGNHALVRAEDESKLPTEICRVAVERGGYRGAWVGLLGEDDAAIRSAGQWGIGEAEARSLEAQLTPSRPGCPLAEAVQTGQAQVRNGARGEGVPGCLQETGVTHEALAALPLLDRDTKGLMVLFADAPFEFNDEELRLLDELAGDLAYGLSALRAHKREQRHLERLRMAGAVFDSTAEGIVVTDPEERIVSVNRAFTEITGYSEQEVVGETPRILQSKRHETGFYHSMWAGLNNYGQWHGEVWNRRKDGSVYPEWLTISTVYDGGELTHYVGVFSDISRLKQSEEELDFLVYHDPLTGLPNRLLFQERAEHALQRAARAGRGVAICVLDLSGFRDINDSRGHKTGDEVLKTTAERIQQAVRKEDSVARMGGDDFLLMLEDAGHGEQATTVARKVLEQFGRPFRYGEDEFYLSASIGISLFPTDDQQVTGLIRNADAAMNRAKQRGRGSFQFYSQDLTDAATERVALEKALRAALERDEFTLVYQPQIELATGRLTGVEALVRWNHPDNGLVTPDRFLPLAETSGLIVPLGHVVLEKAVAQVFAWREAGLDPGCLSVNISAQQLDGEGGLYRNIQDLFARDDGSAYGLELELTEQALMGDIGQVSSELAQLRGLGVGVAVDDFGTGYSSLNYLKHLPVTRLKIDKSFIDDIPGNPSDEAIVRTIIGMGGNLGLRVIAEGVETAEQARFLLQEGCEQAQGYYYDKPLAPEQLETAYLRASPSGTRGFDSSPSRDHT